jgi:hypothetical protein
MGSAAKRASRAPRQTRPRVNVSEDCYNPVYALAVGLMAIEHKSAIPNELSG